MEEIVRLLSTIPKNVEEYSVGKELRENHLLVASIIPNKIKMHSIGSSSCVSGRKIPVCTKTFLWSFHHSFCVRNRRSSVYVRNGKEMHPESIIKEKGWKSCCSIEMESLSIGRIEEYCIYSRRSNPANVLSHLRYLSLLSKWKQFCWYSKYGHYHCFS